MPSQFSTLTSDDRLSEVASLRGQIADLARDVAALVERRGIQLKRAAEETTENAREKVEDYPLATMAGAFAAGAVIGLLVMQRRATTPRTRFESAREDLANYADDLKRSLSRGAREYSLSDRLDRMASALAASDAKESLAPMLDRILGWFGQAKEKAKAAAESAAQVVR